jgi:hypothetical protein
MRSRLYWTAECVTTTWSTWSSGKAMMRVKGNRILYLDLAKRNPK